MRGMILAAGRGERMGALTADTPKPLLKVAGCYLIEYPLQALISMGITDIIINICYQKEKIKNALGDGKRYGVNISYSEEETALESGGGIYQALPFFKGEPFVVISCDIIAEYPWKNLLNHPEKLAHLVLVDNPDFHPKGDFSLNDKWVCDRELKTYTFGNIGVYRPELFAECQSGRFRLADLLKQAIQQQQVTGEPYQGRWQNIGNSEQLHAAAAKVLLPTHDFGE